MTSLKYVFPILPDLIYKERHGIATRPGQPGNVVRTLCFYMYFITLMVRSLSYRCTRIFIHGAFVCTLLQRYLSYAI